MTDKRIKYKDKIEILRAVDSLYQPTTSQKKAKAAFYAIYNNNPICVKEDIDVELAVQFSGEKRIDGWWKNEEFVSWFKNENEFSQRMEYLALRAVDNLEDILEAGYDIEDEVSRKIAIAKLASVKMAAIKLAMEVANKIPKVGSDKNNDLADKLVAQMLAQLPAGKIKQLAKSSDDDIGS